MSLPIGQTVRGQFLSQRYAARARAIKVLDSRPDIKVTLNGKMAVVCGFKKDWATVTQTETCLRAEWAWETVLEILTRAKNPGEFMT
jgi:hypothetical protein